MHDGRIYGLAIIFSFPAQEILWAYSPLPVLRSNSIWDLLIYNTLCTYNS
jgi:hypothetical protein